jgi:hypothetical protein
VRTEKVDSDVLVILGGLHHQYCRVLTFGTPDEVLGTHNGLLVYDFSINVTVPRAAPPIRPDMIFGKDRDCEQHLPHATGRSISAIAPDVK